MTIILSESSGRNIKKECEFNTYYALAQFHDASYRAIKDLMDREGYGRDPQKTQRKVAKKIGKSSTWVSRKLGDAGACSQKALAVFAGNYDKRIVISFVKPGHERIVADVVQILEAALSHQENPHSGNIFDHISSFVRGIVPNQGDNIVEGVFSLSGNQPVSDVVKL
ncbi:hypothetical protein FAI41_02155 [Acetobacteraceae bacterium]|nr:hypothetical protein FAI41_02155 [Acetobacteraceae bacterium]